MKHIRAVRRFAAAAGIGIALFGVAGANAQRALPAEYTGPLKGMDLPDSDASGNGPLEGMDSPQTKEWFVAGDLLHLSQGAGFQNTGPLAGLGPLQDNAPLKGSVPVESILVIAIGTPVMGDDFQKASWMPVLPFGFTVPATPRPRDKAPVKDILWVPSSESSSPIPSSPSSPASTPASMPVSRPSESAIIIAPFNPPGESLWPHYVPVPGITAQERLSIS